jgi:Transposase IS200 like
MVSQVVGYIKGKSAIYLARVYGERKRNFVGQHFWARGFFVNTVGRDEDAIRAYIKLLLPTPAKPGGLPLTLDRPLWGKRANSQASVAWF